MTSSVTAAPLSTKPLPRRKERFGRTGTQATQPDTASATLPPNLRVLLKAYDPRALRSPVRFGFPTQSKLLACLLDWRDHSGESKASATGTSHYANEKSLDPKLWYMVALTACFAEAMGTEASRPSSEDRKFDTTQVLTFLHVLFGDLYRKLESWNMRGTVSFYMGSDPEIIFMKDFFLNALLEAPLQAKDVVQSLVRFFDREQVSESLTSGVRSTSDDSKNNSIMFLLSGDQGLSVLVNQNVVLRVRCPWGTDSKTPATWEVTRQPLRISSFKLATAYEKSNGSAVSVSNEIDESAYLFANDNSPQKTAYVLNAAGETLLVFDVVAALAKVRVDTKSKFADRKRPASAEPVDVAQVRENDRGLLTTSSSDPTLDTRLCVPGRILDIRLMFTPSFLRFYPLFTPDGASAMNTCARVRNVVAALVVKKGGPRVAEKMVQRALTDADTASPVRTSLLFSPGDSPAAQ